MPTARRCDIRAETLHQLPHFVQTKSAYLSEAQDRQPLECLL